MPHQQPRPNNLGLPPDLQDLAEGVNPTRIPQASADLGLPPDLQDLAGLGLPEDLRDLEEAPERILPSTRSVVRALAAPYVGSAKTLVDELVPFGINKALEPKKLKPVHFITSPVPATIRAISDAFGPPESYTEELAGRVGGAVGGVTAALPAFLSGVAGIQKLKYFQTLAQAGRHKQAAGLSMGLVGTLLNVLHIDERGFKERAVALPVTFAEQYLLGRLLSPNITQRIMQGKLQKLTRGELIARVGGWSAGRTTFAAMTGLSEVQTSPFAFSGYPAVDNMLWDAAVFTSLHGSARPRPGTKVPIMVQGWGGLSPHQAEVLGSKREAGRYTFQLRLDNGRTVQWRLGEIPTDLPDRPPVIKQYEGVTPVENKPVAEGDMLLVPGDQQRIGRFKYWFKQEGVKDPVAAVEMVNPNNPADRVVEFIPWTKGVRILDGPAFDSWMERTMRPPEELDIAKLREAQASFTGDEAAYANAYADYLENRAVRTEEPSTGDLPPGRAQQIRDQLLQATIPKTTEEGAEITGAPEGVKLVGLPEPPPKVGPETRIGSLKVGDKWNQGFMGIEVIAVQPVRSLPPGEERIAEILDPGEKGGKLAQVIVERGATPEELAADPKLPMTARKVAPEEQPGDFYGAVEGPEQAERALPPGIKIVGLPDAEGARVSGLATLTRVARSAFGATYKDADGTTFTVPEGIPAPTHRGQFREMPIYADSEFALARGLYMLNRLEATAGELKALPRVAVFTEKIQSRLNGAVFPMRNVLWMAVPQGGDPRPRVSRASRAAAIARVRTADLPKDILLSTLIHELGHARTNWLAPSELASVARALGWVPVSEAPGAYRQMARFFDPHGPDRKSWTRPIQPFDRAAGRMSRAAGGRPFSGGSLRSHYVTNTIHEDISVRLEAATFFPEQFAIRDPQAFEALSNYLTHPISGRTRQEVGQRLGLDKTGVPPKPPGPDATDAETLQKLTKVLDSISVGNAELDANHTRNLITKITEAVGAAHARLEKPPKGKQAGTYGLDAATAEKVGLAALIEHFSKQKEVARQVAATAKGGVGSIAIKVLQTALRDAAKKAGGTAPTLGPTAAPLEATGTAGVTGAATPGELPADIQKAIELGPPTPPPITAPLQKRLLTFAGTDIGKEQLRNFYNRADDVIGKIVRELTATKENGTLDTDRQPQPLSEVLPRYGHTLESFRARISLKGGELAYIPRPTEWTKAGQGLLPRELRPLGVTDADLKAAGAASEADPLNKLIKLHDAIEAKLLRNPKSRALQKQFTEVLGTIERLIPQYVTGAETNPRILGPNGEVRIQDIGKVLTIEQRALLKARGINPDVIQRRLMDPVDEQGVLFKPTEQEFFVKEGPSIPLQQGRKLLYEWRNLKAEIKSENFAKQDPYIQGQRLERLKKVEAEMAKLGVDRMLPPAPPAPGGPPGTGLLPQEGPPGGRSAPPAPPPGAKKPIPEGFLIEVMPEFSTDKMRESARMSQVEPRRIIIRDRRTKAIVASYTSRSVKPDFQFKDRYLIEPVGWVDINGNVVFGPRAQSRGFGAEELDRQAAAYKEFRDGAQFRWRVTDLITGRDEGVFSADSVRKLVNGEWLPPNYDPQTGEIVPPARDIARQLNSLPPNQRPLEARLGSAAVADKEFMSMPGDQQMSHVTQLALGATTKNGAWDAYHKYIGQVTKFPGYAEAKVRLIDELRKLHGLPERHWNNVDDTLQAAERSRWAEQHFKLQVTEAYLKPELGGTGKAYDPATRSVDAVNRVLDELLRPEDLNAQAAEEAVATDVTGKIPLGGESWRSVTRTMLFHMHPILANLHIKAKISSEYANGMLQGARKNIATVFKGLSVPEMIAVVRIREGRHLAGEQVDVLRTSVIKGDPSALGVLTKDARLLSEWLRGLSTGEPRYQKLLIPEKTPELENRARLLAVMMDNFADVAGLPRGQRIEQYFPHFFERVSTGEDRFKLPNDMSIPGEVYFRFFEHRYTDKIDYEVLPTQVLDLYARGWARKISYDPLLTEFGNPEVMNALPPQQRQYLKNYLNYLIGRPTQSDLVLERRAQAALQGIGIRMGMLPDVFPFKGIRRYLLAHGGNNPVQRTAAFLKGMQFLSYIAFVPAVLFTNLVQAPALLLMRHGPTAWLRSIWDSGIFRNESVYQHYFEKAGLAGDVRRSDLGTVMSQVKGLGQHLAEVGARLFGSTEVANRSQAYVLRHRLSKESGMATSDAVINGILESSLTQFDLTRTGRLHAMRGPIGSTVGQFMSYKIEMSQLLGREALNLFSSDPRLRAQSFKRLARFTAVLYILGGIRAVPFGHAISMAMHELSGDDPEMQKMLALIDSISADHALGELWRGEPFEIGHRINPLDLMSYYGLGPSVRLAEELLKKGVQAATGKELPMTPSAAQLVIRRFPGGPQIESLAGEEIEQGLSRMGVPRKEARLEGGREPIERAFGKESASEKKRRQGRVP